MTTADWAPPGSFTTLNSIPGSYSTSTTSDGATIVTSGPYTGFTQTGHGGADLHYALTWESPAGWGTGGGGISAPAVSASTGVNPTETAYALYGHTIPLSVFGVGRIGGEIIAGPWISGGLASFCISFGFPADPTGTRTLKEIAFDSEVVWTLAGGFTTEAFTYRFYGGTLTQAVDALETSHFGADGVAYRPQMLLWFENLPIANTKFKKIPYVAAVISDSSGDDVNLGEAFERLAYSPVGADLTSAEFETVGVTDGLVSGGLILAQDTEFLGLIQQFGRFYRSWDILQTDKLRIVDRGSEVTPDIVLDKSNLTGQVAIARSDPNNVPRTLQLSTIDPDADFTIVPSTAAFPRDPVNVSASIKTEAQYLPAIMDSSTRVAIVTFAKYSEEISRKKVTCTAMIRGLEIEPGALLGLADLADGISDEVYKVKETTHGADHRIEIVAESFMDCQIPALSCAAATAFLARTSGLSLFYRNAYGNLICGLVADGVWSKLDALYVFATHNQTTANLNLVSSSYTVVPQNSPTWSADRGYAGVEGSTGTYLYNGFTPPPGGGASFTTNNAHVSVWSNSSGQSDNYMAGIYGGSPFTGGVLLAPRASNDKSLYLLNNVTGLLVTNTDGKGLYTANMSGGNLLTAYKNGASVGTLSEAAGAPWGAQMSLLAVNFYPGQIRDGTGDQISAASIGGALTAPDHANLYSRLLTFLTAVGVS